MRDFRLSPQASIDLEGIWDYIGIEKDNPTAAFRQIEMLYEKFVVLALHPLLGESREDLGLNLRSFVAGNYVIVYQPTPEEVEIARVIHAARDIRSMFKSS
jgi:toxin ParE1/3/4